MVPPASNHSHRGRQRGVPAALKKAWRSETHPGVLAVPDGFAALERLKNTRFRGGLRIRMPKMAASSCSIASSSTIRMCRVLVTGFDESGRRKSRVQGAFDYLTKPLSVAHC